MSAVLHRAQPARWRPTPTIVASIGLHGLAGAGTAIAPEGWPMALAALGANHLFLGALGLWPRSSLLGANVTRLPGAAAQRGEIALTFDDGPDPDVTPRLLDLLDAAGARATFFCIAARAARHPDLCQEIARRGHSVENHTNAHRPTFPMLGMAGLRGEIAAAQATLAQVSGHTPRFFRPPAGLRNPLLDPVLHAMGLTLVTWTRRGYDTRSGDPQRVAQRLLRGLAAGDILLMHDGHCARTAQGTSVVIEALPRVLAAARERGLTPVTLAQAIAA